MVRLAEACEQLQVGRQVTHPDLAAFQTWEQVMEYIEHDPAGSDLAVVVHLVERFGARAITQAVQSSVPADRADVIVSTAHKAKGLEWSRVRIADDFPEPRDKRTGERLPVPETMAMLAYVAVTRAKDHLDPGGLAWVHARPEGQARLEPEPVRAPARKQRRKQSKKPNLDLSQSAVIHQGEEMAVEL
jgi:ATP-dependent exoDNAse (exonuclease V) beta subunit